MRVDGVEPADLETASSDRISWRSTVNAGIEEAELKRETRWEERRLGRRQTLKHPAAPRSACQPAATATDLASRGLACTATAGVVTTD